MLRSIVLLSFLSSSVLPAATLYTQASTWTTNGSAVGGGSVNQLNSAGTGMIAYDDFSIALGGTVTQVTWRGVYSNLPGNASPNTTDWGLSFYANNGGSPGSMLSTTVLSNAQVTRSSLGTGDLNGVTYDIYEFTANVNAFNAAAGTTYWFSPLAASASTPPSFAWIHGTGGDGSSLQQIFASGAMTGTSTTADLAFTLSGDVPTSGVPEPSTAVFVVCGLAGVAVGRLRRR